jgi:hypothetical protein
MSSIKIKEYCSSIDNKISFIIENITGILENILFINIIWIIVSFIVYGLLGDYSEIYKRSLTSIFLISVAYLVYEILKNYEIKKLSPSEYEYNTKLVKYPLINRKIICDNLKSISYINIGLFFQFFGY